jgi:YggT family protein
MFVLGNFIAAIAHILDTVLTIYMWIIIIRAVLSWVNPDPYNPIVRFIHQVTEPVMAQIRRRLPIGGMGIDFSPIIILLAIVFLQSFVVRSLLELSHQFR